MPRPGYDRFGSSVATIGNNLLVGVPGEDTNSFRLFNNVGVAYLFDGTTGTLLRTFQNPNPTLGVFGWQVAAVGNNALIGTAYALYLFDSNGGNLLWSFQPNHYINSAVVGNNILIGAPNGDPGARSIGTAYLLDGSNGNLLRTFQNPTPEQFDQFGYSVAAVGNNILIGAPGDNTNAPSPGAAYLFDSVTGNLLRTFYSPTPDPGSGFGSSAVAVGDRILIGANGEDRGGISSGAAYLFDSVTGNLVQTFQNPTPEQNDLFGAKVALVGNHVLIGAPYDNGGGNSAPVGAVYLFDSTTGSLLKTFQPSNPQSFAFNPRFYDFFGSSLTALDDRAVIGVAAEMVGGFTSAGAVYLF